MRKLLSGVRRKMRKPATIPVPPGYRQATGLHHVEFFRDLHAARLFDWYLEIGCRTGSSFAPVRGKTIAVDPFFRVGINVIGSKPQLHVFQATSDDFFASGFLDRAGIRLSFSFLDGMHLFEYLLRDFIATEAASGPGSVIAIHDCCPYDPAMTTRDLTRLDRLPGGIWTGDVWKIIPVLQQYRPDLRITVLDCARTGLVLVSDLDPGNRILADNQAAILDRYLDLDIAAYGAERFFGSFALIDARAFLADADGAWTGFWDRATLPEDQALIPRKLST